ncbi:DHH family phosphoesterase [Candidatus Saccharibacteria bacterium]|nr:DHH family phosphoesterase [Candidatus Saccharibacteria bacterium]
MIVVTAGGKYLDIDAYACIIAYAELLNLKGEPAAAVSTAVLNDSITPTARSISTNFQTEYIASDDDQFVVVDVSEPENLDTIVQLTQILEIIDHHLGNEQYWANLNITTDIEFIGAACTQVYERWVRAGKLGEMSESAARLLSLGILDNTLNFNAAVTTQRDIDAYTALTEHAHAPANWAEQYFRECQVAVERNVSASIANDTKQMIFPGYDAELTVGQLAVWDANELLETIAGYVGEPNHFVNVISIHEGVNYIIVKDEQLEGFLAKLLGANACPQRSLLSTDRLWLRKEIMKAAIDANAKKGK